MNLFVSRASVLALLLCASSVGARGDTSLGTGEHVSHIQLIGWSHDERRIALQVYSWGTPQAESQARPCEGSVDPRGKKFSGLLESYVFEQGQRVSLQLLLKDSPCTPPDEARERKARVTEELTGLGIDSKQRGRVFVLNRQGMRIPGLSGRKGPYSLEYVNGTRKETDAEGGARLHGSLQLYLRQGGTRRMLFEQEVDERYQADKTSDYRASLSHVFVSPSGERLVVLAYARQGDATGFYESTWVAATLVLSATVPVQAPWTETSLDEQEKPGEKE